MGYLHHRDPELFRNLECLDVRDNLLQEHFFSKNTLTESFLIHRGITDFYFPGQLLWLHISTLSFLLSRTGRYVIIFAVNEPYHLLFKSLRDAHIIVIFSRLESEHGCICYLSGSLLHMLYSFINCELRNTNIECSKE